MAVIIWLIFFYCERDDNENNKQNVLRTVSSSLVRRLITRIFFFMLFYWENWDRKKKQQHFFVWSLSHCLQVCTSWWKYLYVWVYPPILPQPLAKMDGCHSRLWGSICLWNPPESIPWIYRGGSKPEQEDDETLGQFCSDRVCMNTDWSCTISSRLFSSVLVVFLCFSPRNPSTDKFKWPPLTPENKEYITLNTSPPEIKTHFKAEKCHFWNNIFPQIMNVTGKMSFIHLNSNVACVPQSWQNIYTKVYLLCCLSTAALQTCAP